MGAVVEVEFEGDEEVMDGEEGSGTGVVILALGQVVSTHASTPTRVLLIIFLTLMPQINVPSVTHW